MRRLVYLDGWRGCAVLAVLVAHFGTSKGINLGRFGVEMFFVLSGRLMAEILFTKKADLSTFYVHRFSRVYPALLAFSLSIFLGFYIFKIPGASLYHFLSSITFTYNYFQFFLPRSDVFDHIWSLCIEEHVYILLGGVALVSRRFRISPEYILVPVILVAICVGALQTAAGMDYNSVYWRTDVRGASILIGAVSYLWADRGFFESISKSWVIVAAGVAALMLNANLVPDPIKYSFGTASLALAMSMLPYAGPFFKGVLEWRPVTMFGLWSFSVYLWQQPFSKMVWSVYSKPILLACAMLVALISYNFVEKPARTFINRFVVKRTSPER